jgi:hypothetical protein
MSSSAAAIGPQWALKAGCGSGAGKQQRQRKQAQRVGVRVVTFFATILANPESSSSKRRQRNIWVKELEQKYSLMQNPGNPLIFRS